MSEFEAALKRRDRLFAVAAVEIPSTLPDRGDVGTAFAEWFGFHVRHFNALISATSTVPVTDSVM